MELDYVRRRKRSTISKRQDIALLAEFFTILNDSNLVVPVLKILDTNKVTEPPLVDAIALFLKTQNLDDLLTAVDKSNLAVDIMLKSITGFEVFSRNFQYYSRFNEQRFNVSKSRQRSTTQLCLLLLVLSLKLILLVNSRNSLLVTLGS